MTFNRRLSDLETKINPPGPTQYIVCWCDRDDGQHNEGCPAAEFEADKVVSWDDNEKVVVFTVKYDRTEPATKR